MALISIYLLILWSILTCHGRTKLDDARASKEGNPRYIMGTYVGDLQMINRGIQEGAKATVVLDPHLGENVLGLGEPYVDFPVCPMLHLSFNQGKSNHLNVALYMIGKGVNFYEFMYVNYTKNGASIRGYPLPIMYALGLGRKPENAHAAFLHRFQKTLGDKYFDNFQREINFWSAATDNPPILHIPIYSDFFDGVYALVKYYNVSVNDEDKYGITPLHIAAWVGDKNLVLFLLYHGAIVNYQDSFGRTCLHYAASRGYSEIVSAIIMKGNYSFMDEESELEVTVGSSNPSLWSQLQAEYVHILDSDGRTALQLANLSPAMYHTIDVLQHTITEQLNVSLLQKEHGKKYQTQEILEDLYSNNESYYRGDWFYPPTEAIELQVNSDSDTVEEGNDYMKILYIDVVTSHNFSKGRFKRDYLRGNRPLLVSDHLALGFSIWAYWKYNDFVDRYGNLIVSTGERLHSHEWNPWTLPPVATGKLRDYVYSNMAGNGKGYEKFATCLNNNESPGKMCKSIDINDASLSHEIPTPWVGYCHNASLQESEKWNQDFKRPGLFDVCKPAEFDNEPMGLIIGSIGSGEPLVYSNSSKWDLLIVGKKKWYFIPPSFRSYIHAIPNADLADFHVKSSIEWLQAFYTAYKQEYIISETTQYPGDVVYIPPGWLYVTLNLADTISVSQEFCKQYRTSERIVSLGHSIYGGVDHNKYAQIRQHENKLSIENNLFIKPESTHDNVPYFE